MKLVTAERLLARMAVGVSDDTTTAASDALEAATSQLETILRTEFALGTSVDYFHFERDTDSKPTHQLLLKNGFLTANPTKVLGGLQAMQFTSGNVSELDPISGVQTGLSIQPVDLSGMCLYKLDDGMVMLTDLRLRNMWIQVTYTAGFGVDADDSAGDLYDQARVPDWLQNAALAQAIINLDGSTVFEASDKNAVSPASQRKVIGELVGRHIRYKPSALSPEF